MPVRARVRRLTLAALVVAASSMAPAAARAAEFHVSGTELVMSGDDANRRFSLSPGTNPSGSVQQWVITVSDANLVGNLTGVTAGARCALDAATSSVRCPRTGVDDLTFVGGTGTEVFQVTSAVLSIPLDQVHFSGGAGSDTFRFDQRKGTVTTDMGPGDDHVIVGDNLELPMTAHGGPGDDRLVGGPTAGDELYGDEDDDDLGGRGGGDVLDGGDGSDWLNAGDADDELHGGSGDDALAGGGGGDVIDGGAGEDFVGADHNYNGNFTVSSITLQGDDTILLREDPPERDDVFAGTITIPGGCGGGDDRVEADALDVVPASALCETVERPAVAPAFTLTPAAQEFGSIQAGFNSILRTFTLTNSGGPPAAAVTPTITGADAGQFSVVADTCTGKAPPEFNANPCAVQVRFSPASTGPKSAQLNLAGRTSSLTGTGAGVAPVPVLGLLPASFGFGLVRVGEESPSRDFILSNSGTGTAPGSTTSLAGAHPSDFRVLLDECTNHALAPAGACTVRIRFAPKAAGARTATLTAGGKTASLSGTGEQTTSGGTGSQPPASNPSSPPPAPPPSAPGDLVAPHIAELTKAVQRIAAARAGKLTVGLRTDEPGTWKVEVFGEGPLARASAARRLIGTATRSLAAGGTYSLKVSLKRAARTRLKRLRTAKLLIRSTVTDSSGNAAASTRRVTLKR